MLWIHRRIPEKPGACQGPGRTRNSAPSGKSGRLVRPLPPASSSSPSALFPAACRPLDDASSLNEDARDLK